MSAEILFRIISYLFVLGCFFAPPLLILLAYRVFLRKYVKIKPVWIMYSLVSIQIVLIVFLSIQPIITYDADVSNENIQNHGAWGRSTLERPFAGFYSTNIPILAYRFHIVDLHMNYVVAEIHYLPVGKTEVKWDGFYETTSPLTGL